MKMIIWKELRENAKWAALGFFALLLAELYALAAGREAYVNDSVTLCHETFLMVTAFGCAAVGAGLGAIQILPERRPDQWASLMHRPVSPTVIFTGKVLAGLFLYTLAAGLPLLVSVLYVATPGSFPVPFLPVLALPAGSDLACGAVFYMTAVLVGLTPGSWWKQKVAVGLAAVALFWLHLASVGLFWLPLLGTVVAGLAAAGAMSGPGSSRRWASRSALFVVLLAGVQFGWLLLVSALRWAASDISSIDRGNWFGLALVKGAVVQAGSNRDGEQILLDAQGQAVAPVAGEEVESLYPINLLDRETLAPQGPATTPMGRASYSRLTNISGTYGGPEYWWLVRDPAPFFVGFDKLTGKKVGICDAGGFQLPSARPNFLPADLIWANGTTPLLYFTRDKISAVDFEDRQTRVLLKAGDRPFRYAAVLHQIVDQQVIAVAREDSVSFLLKDGTVKVTVPLSERRRELPVVSIAANSMDRFFLTYEKHDYRVLGEKSESQLEEYDFQGHLLRTLVLQRPAGTPYVSTWSERWARFGHLPLAALLVPHWDWDRGFGQWSSTSSLRLPRDFRPGELLRLFALSVGLSGLAWWWSRRLRRSPASAALWMLLTLLFGVAGLLAFRLCLDVAARRRCPECGRRRSVGHADCQHCGQLWVAPAPTGAEIFEPA